jgi:hypothetical protein
MSSTQSRQEHQGKKSNTFKSISQKRYKDIERDVTRNQREIERKKSVQRKTREDGNLMQSTILEVPIKKFAEVEERLNETMSNSGQILYLDIQARQVVKKIKNTWEVRMSVSYELARDIDDIDKCRWKLRA